MDSLKIFLSKYLLVTIAILAYIHKLFYILLFQEVQLNSPPLVWVGLSDALLMKRVWKRKSSNFIVKKFNRHHLNKVTKVNITSNKSYLYYVPYDMVWWERHFAWMIFFLKSHYPSLIMKKYQTQIEGHCNNDLTSTFQNQVVWFLQLPCSFSKLL